jgi:hypothetical protein
VLDIAKLNGFNKLEEYSKHVLLNLWRIEHSMGVESRGQGRRPNVLCACLFMESEVTGAQASHDVQE